MVNELLLLSGNQIPFKEAKVNIHQPTIKEIAYISEESFYIGAQFLNFSKDILSYEDKVNLTDKTDFDIFMSMINSRDVQVQKNKTCAILVLTLMFPTYRLKFYSSSIVLIDDRTGENFEINSSNYEAFKSILVDMFCLKQAQAEQGEYNPANEEARRIAEKLKKGRQKAAQYKGEEEHKKIAILSRYVSILSVGLKKDMNVLLNYTVYQLYDEFKRFELYQNFDFNFRARMAGAKDLEDVDNWMEDIHP